MMRQNKGKVKRRKKTQRNAGTITENSRGYLLSVWKYPQQDRDIGSIDIVEVLQGVLHQVEYVGHLYT